MKDEECPLIKSDIIKMQRDVSEGDATLATEPSSLVMPTAVALQLLILLLKMVYFYIMWRGTCKGNEHFSNHLNVAHNGRYRI
jgi:hypothetical protein